MRALLIYGREKGRMPGGIIHGLSGPVLCVALLAGIAASPLTGEAAMRPFGVGEQLCFDVYYGPLKAGTARMEVADVESIRGRDCLHLISTARSGALVSAFFRVEDRIESWMDVEHLRPLRFEKHLREGHYQCDQVVEYFHMDGVARSTETTMEIGDGTRDALSSLYWVRTVDLEPGSTFWLNSTSARSSYDLRVDVTGRERIKTPAGEFDCLVVEPHLVDDSGMFDQKGRMWIWLTDDALRLPVQMVSKVAIGSIKAILVDHVLGTMASEHTGVAGEPLSLAE
ncbi:MAG: DUF3108 domain-containing protein [Candidatus Eisenbacteria sp.]|nr:DUF3108 domain-containing protein [Candidatus Eisenbacteria bacterium]